MAKIVVKETEITVLKEEEQKSLAWSAKRELAKINYHIHTDAIKQNLIPAELTAKQTSIIYANEADVLNMENLNAVFINEGLLQRERLIKLNRIAIHQMRVLHNVEGRKILKQ